MSPKDETTDSVSTLREAMTEIERRDSALIVRPPRTGFSTTRAVHRGGVMMGAIGQGSAAIVAAPDPAEGRCQAMVQCHRETGHAGGHEPDPGPPIVAYLVHVDGEDYAYDPAAVTIVRRHVGGHEAREEDTG